MRQEILVPRENQVYAHWVRQKRVRERQGASMALATEQYLEDNTLIAQWSDGLEIGDVVKLLHTTAGHPLHEQRLVITDMRLSPCASGILLAVFNGKSDYMLESSMVVKTYG